MMHELTPKNVKSTKSKQDVKQQDAEDSLSKKSLTKVQSHFLVPSEKLDKVTRRVIAPYAQIERKGLKESEQKARKYLDINRFNVFLDDEIDLDALLYETAMVLKNFTNSSGNLACLKLRIDSIKKTPFKDYKYI